MSKKIKQWIPDPNDDLFDRMPGDFFYIPDEEWFIENKYVIDKFLLALSNVKIITGHAFISNSGIYIDARLPTQDS